MKIILSRKGFDSSAGGCASPIFEDGSLVSLPIPENSARLRYAQIQGKHDIGKIVEDLTSHRRNPLKASDGVHLDPDLSFECLNRKTGWRPLFGQSDAAQVHLENHHVEAGDLVLFFGWFRSVEKHEGRFRYVRGAPDLNLFFGWMEVGSIWRLSEENYAVPEWALNHPHSYSSYKRNTIYVAAEAGSGYKAGVFSRYSGGLVLTAPGKSRSQWRLPKWLYPAQNKTGLSYHGNPRRWSYDDKQTGLKSVGRGQEFVLDVDQYPEAKNWAEVLIGSH